MAEAMAFAAVSAVVSTGISYLFPSNGPRLRDLKISASTYGNIIPQTYGLCRVAGNMIWAAPIQERKKKKKAGKGGSYYNEFTYFADFAMAFCQGPIDTINRIWADGKLIYDATGKSAASNDPKYRFSIYQGTETQLPDPTMIASGTAGGQPSGFSITIYKDANYGSKSLTFTGAVPNLDTTGLGLNDGASSIKTTGRWEVFEHANYQGRSMVVEGDVANLATNGSGLNDKISSMRPLVVGGVGESTAPAYRGLCYVVFDDFPLADFGNRIPQMAAEVYRGAVGEAQSTKVTYVPQNGKTAGYAPDLQILDSERGYLYQTVYADPTNAIRRISMFDAKEDLFIVPTFPHRSPNWHVFDRADDGSLNNILAVTSRGELICSYGGINNATPLAVLDANSYAVIASYGSAEAFHYGLENGQPTVSFANEVGSCALGGYEINGRTVEHYLHSGLFGDISVFDVTDPAKRFDRVVREQGPFGWEGPRWGTELGLLGYRPDHFVVPRDPLKDQPPTWYAVVEAPTGIVIKRVTNSGQPIVFEMPKPTGLNGSMLPLSAYWDTALSGVVFHWKIGSNHFISKWSEAANAVVWTRPVAGNVGPDFASRNATVTNGKVAFIADTVKGTRVFLIETDTGNWIDPTQLKNNSNTPAWEIDAENDIQVIANDPYVTPLAQYGYQPIKSSGFMVAGNPTLGFYSNHYDARRNVIVTTGSRGDDRVIFLGSSGNDATTLSGIVGDLLRKTGLDRTQYDLAAIEGVPVYGYGFASETDIKNILSELKQVYLFDLVESDGKLRAVVRGDSTPKATISSLALGSSGSEDGAEHWVETRIQEHDLPARITLAYSNVDLDFETSTAHAKRIVSPISTMYSKQQATLEMNVVMTATEAKNRVHAMLHTQWGERTMHEGALPWAYMDLDPGDVIAVNFPDGRNYIERLHQTELGADYSIVFQTFGQDSGAYVTNQIGDSGGSGRTQTIPIPREARAFILNLPLLRDSDDTGGGTSRYYTAIGNATRGDFLGASLLRSVNNQDYEDVYSETDDVEWGAIKGTVPAPRQGVFGLDWETRITIVPVSKTFELESINDDLLWEGGNACVIGDEVIQFRDAVENEDGTWTIFNLLRGRRGTEWACGKQGAGAPFLFLNDATVTPQSENLSAKGQTRWFKAVGSGRSLLSTVSTQTVYQPRDLMPYAPVQIKRTKNGSGDITISWERRTRMGGNLMDDIGDVPLNEGSKAYEVYVLAEPFDGDLSTGEPPKTFLKKFDATTESVTWLASDIGGTAYRPNIDSLHVVVYQVSTAVGRGFPGVRKIEPWRDN